MLEKLIKARRQLLYNLLISILISIILIALISLTNWIITTKLMVILIILLALLFYIWPIRPKMFYHHQMIAYLKMKNTQIDERKTNIHLISESFIRSLEKHQFKITQDYGEFILYYRLTKDKNEFKYNRGTLEIAIIIKNEQTKFNDQMIEKAINNLEDFLKKNKNRYKDYIILQFRKNDQLTDELIHEADQVVFDKQQKRFITRINVIEHKESKLYYLASKNYHPSMHYQYAVDLIKKLT